MFRLEPVDLEDDGWHHKNLGTSRISRDEDDELKLIHEFESYHVLTTKSPSLISIIIRDAVANDSHNFIIKRPINIEIISHILFHVKAKTYESMES